MTHKIFINTVSVPSNILEQMLADNGDNVWVVPNTVDVREFLDNIPAVKEAVANGKLVFHAWAPTWRSQWQKSMISSALGGKFVPAGKVDEMIPEAEELGTFIDSVAVPREQWLEPDWSFSKAPKEIFEQLKIEYTENRTIVFQACDTQNRMDLKLIFESWYVARMADQHGCNSVAK